jgi:hypothetical protein
MMRLYGRQHRTTTRALGQRGTNDVVQSPRETSALQDAIFNSAYFSGIATDEKA